MVQTIGIDHVGIIVNDIDEAIDTFTKFVEGSTIEYRDDNGVELNETGKVVEKWKIAYINSGNDIFIELIQPRETGFGTIGQYLEKYGEGLHHVSINVPRDEFDKHFDLLSELGFDMVGEQPWRSSPDSGRDNIFTYIHPNDTHGVLVEFVSPYEFKDGEMIPK